MFQSSTFKFDALVTGGLVGALLLVLLLDKLLPTAAQSGAVQVKTTTPTPTPAAEPLKLAVVPSEKDDKVGFWDDMGRLLEHLGEGYKFETVHPYQLLERATYKNFNVLFLTCAPGGEDLKDRLYDFVNEGGTLYASDWRYDCIKAAFPAYQDPRLEDEGKKQSVMALVQDPGLRDVLGSPTVPLKFDMPQWKIAAFKEDKVKVLLKGTYQKQSGTGMAEAPLLVKFQVGKGTVIFTSFHNEKQNSEVEMKLLKYLVFSAVTAEAEAKSAQTMLEGGFSPQRSNLLSASNDDPKVTQTYPSKKPGKLRFELSFKNLGARLKLTVVSPDGNKEEKEGFESIHIEMTSATAGNWQYTVTALHIPYANFPFHVLVGEPK